MDVNIVVLSYITLYICSSEYQCLDPWLRFPKYLPPIPCDLREDHIAWLEAKHILAIFKPFLSFHTLPDFLWDSLDPGPKLFGPAIFIHVCFSSARVVSCYGLQLTNRSVQLSRSCAIPTCSVRATASLTV